MCVVLSERMCVSYDQVCIVSLSSVFILFSFLVYVWNSAGNIHYPEGILPLVSLDNQPILNADWVQAATLREAG